MIALPQTHLEATPELHVALEVLSAQGHYGEMTRVAEAHSMARSTAYERRDEAVEVLKAHYHWVQRWGVRGMVAVDVRQLERFVISQYVEARSTIRRIENVIPITYPGLKLSYGVIQEILANAQLRAGLFNRGVRLEGIEAVALDEMFSQGRPVLAGVDLDTGYIIDLAKRRHRDAKNWAALLEDAKQRGLKLTTVVKDAGSGMAAGVTKAFPEAEQRDDMFHAIYEMGKVRLIFERRACGALENAEKAYRNVSRVARKRYDTPEEGQKARRTASGLLGAATVKANALMAQHDLFEVLMREVVAAMQIVDPSDGSLNTQGRAEQRLVAAAQSMQQMDSKKAQKVGRYIENRAPGLALYIRQVGEALALLTEKYRELPVLLAVNMWQLCDDLLHKRRPWEKTRMQQSLRGASVMLHRLLNDPEQEEALYAEVLAIMVRRHRASSAIEGFNAALRPYLYIHKGVTQGFLDLFQAYHNLKTRRWGRHKGTSAYECLTGHKVGDWLSMLGYPPTDFSAPASVVLH